MPRKLSPLGDFLPGPSTQNDHSLGSKQLPLKRVSLFLVPWFLSPFLSLPLPFSFPCCLLSYFFSSLSRRTIWTFKKKNSRNLPFLLMPSFSCLFVGFCAHLYEGVKIACPWPQGYTYLYRPDNQKGTQVKGTPQGHLCMAGHHSVTAVSYRMGKDWHSTAFPYRPQGLYT